MKLAELLAKARIIMNADEDSLILFKSRTQQWLEKQVVGRERSSLDTLL